jgi:hypothetical protein
MYIIMNVRVTKLAIKRFNAFTGTALCGLCQKNKWFDYLQYMFDSLPVKKVAQRVNIEQVLFIWNSGY